MSDQLSGNATSERIAELEAGLQLIREAGAIHGGAWCAAQAHGYLESLDYDMWPDTGKPPTAEREANTPNAHGLGAPVESGRECGCYRCLTESGETFGGFPVTFSRMTVCSQCGCKRCPHGTDHRLCCTESNDPGQEGSRYGTPLANPSPADVVAKSEGRREALEEVIRMAGEYVTSEKDGCRWRHRRFDYVDELVPAIRSLASIEPTPLGSIDDPVETSKPLPFCPECGAVEPDWNASRVSDGSEDGK